MFKAPLIVFAAAGLVLSAGTAFAKEAGSDEPTTRMTVKQKDGHAVYCVRDQAKTGQLMGNTICKSRAEWAEAGINIPANSRSSGEGAKSAGTARLSN